jgi:hypothetical protein
VEASPFDAGTAYVSLDGHRSDDLKPYVYVTRDYGRTWTAIAGDLPPNGNVNTVRQDPRNPNLLYAGTEFGFFVSLDDGKSWKPFMTNLPVARIDDVIIHPRDNDLVLSTHGRSIWIMDDISALQQLTPAAMAQEVVLFQPRNAIAWKEDIRLRRSVTGAKNYRGESAADGTMLSYYLKNASGDAKLTIRDLATGEIFRTITAPAQQGMNRVRWNLCSDPREVPAAQAGGGGFGGGGGGGCGGGGGAQAAGGPEETPPAAPGQQQQQQQQRRVARLARPGAYSVTLTVGGRDYTRSVSVLDDAWMEQR